MRAFDNLRLGVKLYLLVGLVLLIGISATALCVLEMKQQMLAARIEELRAIVDIGSNIATELNKQVEGGAISRDEAIRSFTQRIRSLIYDHGQGYIFAFRMDGTVINLPNPKLIGTNYLDTPMNGRAVIHEMRDAVRASGATVIRYDFPRPLATTPSPKISYAVTFPPWDMFLGSGAYIDDLEAHFDRLFAGLAGGVAAMVVLVGGAAWLFSRRITQPLIHLQGSMRRLAAGDLDVDIQGAGRRDEVGDMAAAVAVFKANAAQASALQQEQEAARAQRAEQDARLRQQAAEESAAASAELVVGSIGRGLSCLAAGDMTYVLQTELPGRYEGLRNDLNSAAAEMRKVLSQIQASTMSIRSGTEEIAHAADNLAKRTETQAASLEQTAAALGEITATVDKTAAGAAAARDAVSQTRSDALQSAGVMRQAVDAMGEIEQSSRQIGVFIGAIDEIAFQTNLLALNAGVEAARAGETGRGFAVVASEVRALAQRSAEAAREIKTLVGNSSRQVDAGVKLVAQTGEALQRILSQVGEISRVVAEIAGSAQEQANGLREVNSAVSQMDQATQQNAAMVEQTTTATRTLAERTEELAEMTGHFRLEPQAGAEPGRRSVKRVGVHA